MSIFWRVIIIIVLLFFAILQLRVGVYASYQKKELILKLKIGRIGLTVFPQKPKTARQLKREAKRQAKKAKEKSVEASQSAAKSTYDRKDLVKRLLPEAGPLLNKFGKKLYIAKLRANLRFGTREPMQTAIIFGEVQRIVGQLWALLEVHVRMGDAHLHLEPDFECNGFDGEGEVQLSIKIGQGISLGFYALRVLLKHLNASKAAYAAEHQEQAAA